MFLFLCVISYAVLTITTKQSAFKHQIEIVTQKNDDVFKQTYNALLPQVHEVYINSNIKVSYKYDSIYYKWYTPSQVNMYCNKTCHELMHIKIKINLN